MCNVADDWYLVTRVGEAGWHVASAVTHPDNMIVSLALMIRSLKFYFIELNITHCILLWCHKWDNSLQSTTATTCLPYCQMKTQYLINFTDILPRQIPGASLRRREGVTSIPPVSCLPWWRYATNVMWQQSTHNTTYCYSEHNRNLQTYRWWVSSVITVTTQGDLKQTRRRSFIYFKFDFLHHFHSWLNFYWRQCKL